MRSTPFESYLTLEQADAVPDDAAKGYGRSALLAAAGAEGAKPCATATSHTHILDPSTTSALLMNYSHTSAAMHDTPPAFMLVKWG